MATDIEAVGQIAESSLPSLLAPFDNLPDDFDALKQELRDILAAGTPTHSLLQARRVLEFILQDVYERRFREPTDKLELAEMADQLLKGEQIPPLIYYNAAYVRNLGNVGAHPKRPRPGTRSHAISAEEVASVIAMLVPIVQWYVKASQSGGLDAPAVAREVKPARKVRLAIVPKGLDSFDAGDSSFFLKLLPGPFHADDLPESIHFWKERIEKETTFTVGVIYGKSGCGKSSLVKAGLLPRLAETVKRVYLEATADETEKEVLEGLRRQVPRLSPDLDLKGSIEALQQRPGGGSKDRPLLEGRQKVLIVIDQFEQWLHAHRGEKETELACALRQCVSERVQVLVSVRDDFLEAVSEFMEELRRGLKEGQNCRRVALFEQDHARQVLMAFGRAFEKLGDELTPEQELFLDEVIKALAQDHRVICVRLALFAWMFRGREWKLEALRAVGGIEGIDATFLEETFCSPSADTRKYGNHRDGSIAILKALLPEEGAEIKGRRRSAAELMEAAGYQGHPREFARLIEYLDSELRLITPTSRDAAEPGGGDGDHEPGGGDGDHEPGATPATRYYQLTHDYLVPSLRKWLTRKLQETHRGRASLLLKARSEHWKNSSHDDRHMPTAREYLVIRAFTRSAEWTEDQRTMMQHAGRVHLRKAVAFLIMLPVVVLFAAHLWGARHAEDLVETLLSADIQEVPAALQKLSGYHRWADPILSDQLEPGPETGPSPEAPRAERKKTLAALALLPVDPGRLSYLHDRLVKGEDIEMFPILCRGLIVHSGELSAPLWKALEDSSNASDRRFRAAMALAQFAAPPGDAEAARWSRSAPFVAHEMLDTVVADLTAFKIILNMLRPVRRHLVGPLSDAYKNPDQLHQTHLAAILAEYAEDQPKLLAELVVGARNPDAFAHIGTKILGSSPEAKDQAAERLEALLDARSPATMADAAAARKANAVVALYQLGRLGHVWPLLKPARDPRVRSYIIDRLSQMKAIPDPLIKRLSIETDDGIRQALILALGEYKEQMQEGDLNRVLPESERPHILRQLEDDYREAADPGVRAAAEWMLRTWGRADRLARIDEMLRRSDTERHRTPKGQRWFVNSEGQTMVVIPRAGRFKVGPSRGESTGYDAQIMAQRDVTIDYQFAIGAHEVTLEEFRGFNANHPYRAEDLKPRGELDVHCPVNNVLWYDAVAYCNWLSQRDGIPEDQWCYRPDPKTKRYAAGMTIVPGFTALTGYRLPTEVEWEYACRAGTITSRYYGEADELLVKYAWFQENSGKMLWPVGSKMPNALGLFDTLGNAIEWCQDAFRPSGQPAADLDDSEVRDDRIRVMRGEKMLSYKDNIRAARRETKKYPNTRDFICGFRVARTYFP